MPKGSPELTNARKEEIVNACERLYKTMSFKEITIKEIGEVTSFTRTSIYNYFQTKEEIFLALLTREYEYWTDDLKNIAESCETPTAESFADKIAHSLERRPQLLKILSMNHYDMEENSRIQYLTDMKVAYGRSIKAVYNCLSRFFPQMTDGEKQNFIYVFFPFMFGIYPYAVVTEKQREAMEAANVDYVFMSIYEIIYRCILNLLK